MSINQIKNKILPVLKRSGVKKAAIFGSYARGDYNKKSDVDIWIELDDEKSLFDLIDLQLKLEKELKKKVDLGEYCAIRPRIKENIIEVLKIIKELKINKLI